MKNLFFIVLSINLLFANSFDYKLKPIKLSDNSYYFYGKEEYFSEKNGGNIANTAFIITKNSVILIDTGSSKEYAEQLKEAIKKITNKPIKYVINTHHHPDHFLGNNAFKDNKIYASKFTQNEISQNGDLYIMNLVNIVQKAMQGTKMEAPNVILNTKTIDLDGYKLDVLYFDGHTSSDIVLFDRKTNILYTSDLIFNKRALATPHANIKKWISSLKKLKKINYSILVPGHGKASKSKEPIKENIAYLEFLENSLINGVKNGLDIFEILSKPVPNNIKEFSMFEEEYERSIINLYPKYEQKYYSISNH
ncbi:MAG: MBL fold metallo-hydrolase [Arcobacter sp.]|nr:MAG: MBL fold metallo-hydrolase [Arcobacter sp.]